MTALYEFDIIGQPVWTAYHGTAATLQVPIPTGAAADDLMLMFAYNLPAATVSVDQGWTIHHQASGGLVLSKTHTGSETDPTLTRAATGHRIAATIVVIRGHGGEQSLVGTGGPVVFGNTSTLVTTTPATTGFTELSAKDVVFGFNFEGDDGPASRQGSDAVDVNAGDVTWRDVATRVTDAAYNSGNNQGDDSCADLWQREIAGGSSITPEVNSTTNFASNYSRYVVVRGSPRIARGSFNIMFPSLHI